MGQGLDFTLLASEVAWDTPFLFAVSLARDLNMSHNRVSSMS